MTLRSGASENPVSGVVEAVPELRDLSMSVRTQIFAFLERKFEKLTRKLTDSRYEQCQRSDPLGINQNFASAVCRWVTQFPEQYRLGLLCAAISVSYIPEQEFDLLLDTAVEKLKAAVADKTGLYDNPSLDSHLSQRVVPYAVSEFRACDKVLRKIGVEGSRDDDKRPEKGMLDNFLKWMCGELFSVAEYGEQFDYFDRVNTEILKLIRGWLNMYVVLVEDCSFSGTRIHKDVGRLLRLNQVLFNSFSAQIRESGKQPPLVYLVLPFGTKEAWDSIDPLTAFTGERGKYYTNYDAIFGFTFDPTSSARTSIPDSLEEFTLLLPSTSLYSKLRDSLKYFHETHSHQHWTVDQAKSVDRPEKLAFGFAGGGWTIVTHTNCPNNSLPPLWYPLARSSESSIHALFPRLESRKTHVGSDFDVDDALDTIGKDSKGHLKKLFESLYADIL